ncbi:hypothetical protein H1R17_02875 [Flavobacterium sp. xlx-214]|uniref:hypothetical protein n=1 Tax=unclassified Flavobacterium TaxID=196869 RepID=UPI0013D522B2|nr:MULTISPECIES: hypothetical protein [unclassified Flavobacterium]MBA5793342.1 hypothetical protein [Flavobacterium sp. xlx-221]QMI84095.1 hypothetical protein H1R17_02875 [Flavobacterium sp. xlx-214]
MNFDELQKKWDNQPEKDIEIKSEYLTKTKSLAEQIIKSFKREAIIWGVSIVFILVVPFIDIYQIKGLISFIYYFLVFQFIIFGLYYYRRFYTISKMIKQPNTFNSRESIIRLYYEFHFAIETYRSSIYVLLPTSIALFVIMSGKDKTTDIIDKFYHFNETLQTDPSFIYSVLIVGSIVILLLILFSEWVIKRFYGRYLKQLKELMNQFEE